jgi:hypothetical protein
MTTTPMPNSYLSRPMQECIHTLEQNGFRARRILPVDPEAGIHAREFRADFAKQTPTGLLVFSVRIDPGGNVTTSNR